MPAAATKIEVNMLHGLVILSIALIALDLLASRFGRDTRDGDDWLSHQEQTEQMRYSAV